MSPETRAELDKLAARLRNLSTAGKARPTAGKAELAAVHTALAKILDEFDPIKAPPFIFDPTHPKVAGRLAALVLNTCERQPLATESKFYGSGVYALYYRGQFPAYRALAGSEHPIYVGQADPAIAGAKTPQQQGARLWRRLNDHRKSITNAANLDVADFDYRALAIQSGFESVAETYLIQLFQPVWNSETRICYGIGKHGDSATTRANKRSPWDTLHHGRSWAHTTASIPGAKPEATILEEIQAHLKAHPPYASVDEIVKRFLFDLAQ